MTQKWKNLIRPEKAEFKDGWENEKEFDQWLVSSDGLLLLEEETGISLQPDSVRLQEAVGGFFADIYALDVRGNMERVVVIENQLGTTNHDHLGKVLTYAGALANDSGCHLLWLAERFRDEHRAAIDWLNAKTDFSTNFFALEVAVEKYGEGLIPRLKLICQPNDWSGEQKANVSSALSETKAIYADFWPAFSKYMSSKSTPLKSYREIGAYPQHWTNYQVNKIFYFSIDLSIQQSTATINVYIDGSSNIDGHRIVEDLESKQGTRIRKELDHLFDNKVEFVKAGKKHRTGRIRIVLNQIELKERDRWVEYFNIIRECAEAFDSTINPLVRDFPINDYSLD